MKFLWLAFDSHGARTSTEEAGPALRFGGVKKANQECESESDEHAPGIEIGEMEPAPRLTVPKVVIAGENPERGPSAEDSAVAVDHGHSLAGTAAEEERSDVSGSEEEEREHDQEYEPSEEADGDYHPGKEEKAQYQAEYYEAAHDDHIAPPPLPEVETPPYASASRSSSSASSSSVGNTAGRDSRRDSRRAGGADDSRPTPQAVSESSGLDRGIRNGSVHPAGGLNGNSSAPNGEYNHRERPSGRASMAQFVRKESGQEFSSGTSAQLSQQAQREPALDQFDRDEKALTSREVEATPGLTAAQDERSRKSHAHNTEAGETFYATKGGKKDGGKNADDWYASTMGGDWMSKGWNVWPGKGGAWGAWAGWDPSYHAFLTADGSPGSPQSAGTYGKSSKSPKHGASRPSVRLDSKDTERTERTERTDRTSSPGRRSGSKKLAKQLKLQNEWLVSQMKKLEYELAQKSRNSLLEKEKKLQEQEKWLLEARVQTAERERLRNLTAAKRAEDERRKLLVKALEEQKRAEWRLQEDEERMNIHLKNERTRMELRLSEERERMAEHRKEMERERQAFFKIHEEMRKMQTSMSSSQVQQLDSFMGKMLRAGNQNLGGGAAGGVSGESGTNYIPVFDEGPPGTSPASTTVVNNYIKRESRDQRLNREADEHVRGLERNVGAGEGFYAANAASNANRAGNSLEHMLESVLARKLGNKFARDDMVPAGVLLDVLREVGKSREAITKLATGGAVQAGQQLGIMVPQGAPQGGGGKVVPFVLSSDRNQTVRDVHRTQGDTIIVNAASFGKKEQTALENVLKPGTAGNRIPRRMMQQMQQMQQIFNDEEEMLYGDGGDGVTLDDLVQKNLKSGGMAGDVRADARSFAYYAESRASSGRERPSLRQKPLEYDLPDHTIRVRVTDSREHETKEERPPGRSDKKIDGSYVIESRSAAPSKKDELAGHSALFYQDKSLAISSSSSSVTSSSSSMQVLSRTKVPLSSGTSAKTNLRPSLPDSPSPAAGDSKSTTFTDFTRPPPTRLVSNDDSQKGEMMRYASKKSDDAIRLGDSSYSDEHGGSEDSADAPPSRGVSRPRRVATDRTREAYSGTQDININLIGQQIVNGRAVNQDELLQVADDMEDLFETTDPPGRDAGLRYTPARAMRLSAGSKTGQTMKTAAGKNPHVVHDRGNVFRYYADPSADAQHAADLEASPKDDKQDIRSQAAYRKICKMIDNFDEAGLAETLRQARMHGFPLSDDMKEPIKLASTGDPVPVKENLKERILEYFGGDLRFASTKGPGKRSKGKHDNASFDPHSLEELNSKIATQKSRRESNLWASAERNREETRTKSKSLRREKRLESNPFE